MEVHRGVLVVKGNLGMQFSRPLADYSVYGNLRSRTRTVTGRGRSQLSQSKCAAMMGRGQCGLGRNCEASAAALFPTIAHYERRQNPNIPHPLPPLLESKPQEHKNNTEPKPEPSLLPPS